MSESSFYFNPYSLTSFVSFLIMTVLAFFLWSRHNTVPTRFVILLFLANAVYSLFYALEISFGTLPEVLWVYRFEYVGISFLSPFFLMFTLHFTGKGSWLTRRNTVLLLTVPVVTLLMVFTNSYHHLFHSNEALDTGGPFPTLSFQPALWYYLHQLYVNVLMLISFCLLGKMLKSAAHIYSMQLKYLILAAIFPFAGYLLHLLRLVPFEIDPVSFTFTLSGICVFVALTRFRLFDLAPIARSELFEKIRDGVAVFDRKHRLADYNQAAGQYLSLEKKDLGRSVEELVERWPELAIITDNGTGSQALRQDEKNKAVFYDIQVQELSDTGNTMQGKLVIIKDVSDLINAERERNLSVSKLDAVVNALPDLMFIIDSNGVISDFFATDAEKLFLNRDEVVGASLHQLFSQEEADSLMVMLSDCLQSDRLNTYQYEMNFPGVLKHYEARISRMDMTRVLVIVRDVSESYDMKQSLLHQSGFQKILMNLASRFIYFAEDEADAVISDSLRQIGEYLHVGRSYVFLYDPDGVTMSNTHEWCKEGVPSLRAERQMVSYDTFPGWPALHRRGEVTMVENLKKLNPADPVRNMCESLSIRSIIAIPMISQKNCLGFVGLESVDISRVWPDSDISLLKIFTGMLANLQEKIMIERSLAEAREKAEASNRLKTAFMNNISHEIRTPLNGIIGFGEIIASEHLSTEEKNHFLTVVQESSQRLIQTIDDYLDISMLVTGNQEVRLVKFMPSQILDELVEEFVPLASSKGLTLSLEVPVALKHLSMYSDPHLIHKIFSHLVGNSVKFTEQGFIRIGFAKEGDRLNFFVSDSGIGIAESAQKFIFESFMQEDFSSTRTYEGSGLGLSIVKGIVSLLGGEVELRSEKNKGSTFVVSMPIAIPDDGSFPKL